MSFQSMNQINIALKDKSFKNVMSGFQNQLLVELSSINKVLVKRNNIKYVKVFGKNNQISINGLFLIENIKEVEYSTKEIDSLHVYTKVSNNKFKISLKVLVAVNN